MTEAIYFNNGSVSIAGLENSNELQVGLYPNPTTNRITINFSNSEMNLRILDVQNKEILNTNVVNGENISLIDFEPGCYLFELTSKDNQVVKRVIKLNE